MKLLNMIWELNKKCSKPFEFWVKEMNQIEDFEYEKRTGTEWLGFFPDIRSCPS